MSRFTLSEDAVSKVDDLSNEDNARRAAREALEPTLPWRVKIVIESAFDGEEIFTWDPKMTFISWDDVGRLTFSPHDTRVDTG